MRNTSHAHILFTRKLIVFNSILLVSGLSRVPDNSRRRVSPKYTSTSLSDLNVKQSLNHNVTVKTWSWLMVMFSSRAAVHHSLWLIEYSWLLHPKTEDGGHSSKAFSSISPDIDSFPSVNPSTDIVHSRFVPLSVWNLSLRITIHYYQELKDNTLWIVPLRPHDESIAVPSSQYTGVWSFPKNRETAK